MKLQSRALPDKAFPIPTDTAWKIEWKEISEKDAKYEFIAGKKFSGGEELHDEYANLPDTNIIGIRIAVNKRFEWFFSYLEYDETYFFRNPFGNVPVGEYLSKDEAARFVGGEKSDSLKHKVERWTMRDMFEEVYRPLIDEAKRLNDSTLSSRVLEDRKEEFFALVSEVDSMNSKKGRPESGRIAPAQDNVDSAEAVCRLLVKFLHTDAAIALCPAVRRGWNSLETKLARMNHPDGWVSSVHMPGLIVETNGKSVEGNTIGWKFDPQQIQVGDLTMRATSRVANVWAFIVTGILALAALSLLVFPRRR
jgi:hypothetical protein